MHFFKPTHICKYNSIRTLGQKGRLIECVERYSNLVHCLPRPPKNIITGFFASEFHIGVLATGDPKV